MNIWGLQRRLKNSRSMIRKLKENYSQNSDKIRRLKNQMENTKERIRKLRLKTKKA